MGCRQALLLPNWVAVLPDLSVFGILFFGRIAEEERMMLEAFAALSRLYGAHPPRHSVDILDAGGIHSYWRCFFATSGQESIYLAEFHCAETMLKLASQHNWHLGDLIC